MCIRDRSVIGLETPNTHREMIYLSELLRSKEYDKSTSPLTLALGKDIAGRPTVADLARMPHLLVAGTTGSGKSVIGLEIPNTSREMIYLSELLRSKEYDKSTSPLTIALGKDCLLYTSRCV